MLNGSNRYGGHSEQQVVVAEQLRTIGIEPGDHIALIGDGMGESYWARLAKVKIIAEVPQALETGDSATAFWNSDINGEQAVLNALKGTGAKAVIANTPQRVLSPGWVPVGNTGYTAYFFR
jgi:hypothetical protein